ncbi:hypothetical protein DM02DRAFT_658863 [Periconia macrospinosa]|uniref:Uncharacterized protein n=1 Tax=Periconia macrospinosa TaxID=97972 RepID=A0A2V1DFH1_9PLEO|nr:hypothetical protein DM02DRAFT_658863 [Periconia macrospinosa]
MSMPNPPPPPPPPAERERNNNGRASRASGMSDVSSGQPWPSRASSRGPPPSRSSQQAPPQAQQPQFHQGIASMLRTSTEMGSVGGITSDLTGVPTFPPKQRRSGTTSRNSARSSHSTRSAGRTSQSQSQYQDYGRTASRQSRENMNNVPWVSDSLSPTIYSVAGSSPLVPRAQQQLGPRSRSLTTAQTAGMRSQPSQYSVGSPPSYDFLRRPPSRPESPVPNSYRMQRPSGRPGSPALSENNVYPQPPRPTYGNGHQYRQSSFPVAVRNGYPSDFNINQLEGPYGWSGPPSRSRTPASVGEFGPENQPPLTQYRHPVPSRRGMSQRSQRSIGSEGHQSAKASLSSQSTNQRFDSDGPSSDATNPPTPQDNQLGNHTLRSLTMNPMYHEKTVTRKEEVLYYDGSEAFEMQESSMIHHETHDIKTIEEEQPAYETITSRGNVNIAEGNVGAVAAREVEVAEPQVSSPVPRRLTRDFVKSVLEPVSTIGNLDSSRELAETVSQDVEKDDGDQETVDSGQKPSTVALRPVEQTVSRHSILSQAESTIMNSSTLKFAVDSAIPIVAEKGITMETEGDDDPAREYNAQSPTEDGMSDLLDRYQHTDDKTEGDPLNDVRADTNDGVEKKGNHVAKPSDEQSFKPCADRMNTNEQSVQNSIPVPSENYDGLPAPGKPRNDAHTGSFKTCKDTVTPDRMNSLPIVQETPSDVVGSTVLEPNPEKLRSQPPAGVPAAVDENWPLPVNRDINASQSMTGQQSSMNAPAKSSSAPLLDNGKHKPPVIPPRQSSNKPIAKLLRPFFSRRSKTGSDISSKGGENTIPEDASTRADGSKIPTPPPMRDRPVSGNMLSAVDKEPDSQKDRGEFMNISHREHPSALAVGAAGTDPSSVLKPEIANAFSSDKAINAPRSNQYPPMEHPFNDSSSNFRAQSSPFMSVENLEPNHRDSQSTTHLSWPNPRSVSRPVNPYEQSRATMHEKEETTTDLARPGYTYQSRYQSGYLPDVKEESHEDSSLNTSASNLKRSSVRLDRGGNEQEVRAVDDVSMPVRDMPAQSQSMSALERSHLPSLYFTKDNLMADVLQKLPSSESVEVPETEQQGPVDDDTRPKEAAGAIYKDKLRSLFSPLYKKASPEKVAARQAAVDQAVGKKALSSDRQRNLSPHLMEELDKLTVPSTEDLNERISGYLESKGAGEIGETSAEWVDSSGGGFVKTAIEKIHEVGSGPTNKSSNARLRAVPGSPKLMLVHDEVYQNMTGRKEVEGGGQGLGVVGGAAEEKDPHPNRARDTGSVTTTSLTPAPATTPALQSTPRSLPLANLESETHRNSTSSLRSASSAQTGSSTDTRPWNSSRNYPWAKDSSADFALTSPATPRYPPRLGPSHLRYGSGASSETVTPSTATPSPTPLGSSPPPSRGAFSSASTRGKVLTHHRPTSNRRNITIRSAPLEPISENSWPPGAQEVTVAHVAGERYPPSYHQRDSHFPAEDVDHAQYASDEEPVLSPRRQSRSEKKKARRDAKTRLEEHRQSCTEDSLDLPSRRNRNTFTGVEGMPKVTYITKNTIKKVKDFGRRIAEKLRNLRPHKARSFEPRVSIDRTASLRAPRD